MKAYRALAFLVVALLTSQPSVAQTLQFYLSKDSMDCIVENEAAYVEAKTYDFAIVFPAVCPDLPEGRQTTVGNEYLRLPETTLDTPKEPEAIIVPINRFACLRSLAQQTTEAAATELLLVDLEACSILR